MMTELSIPKRWAFLFDEDGQIDPYRLSSFHVGAGVKIYAICGTHAGHVEMVDLAVAVQDGSSFALVTDDPIRQVYGRALSEATLTVVVGFIRQNRSSLSEHWLGILDSIELARRLKKGQ